MNRQNSLRLPLLPPVEPDELIAGYPQRAAIMGGWPRLKDLAGDLAGRQVIEGPWTLPANLEQVCRVLSPVFASAEEIVDAHTCLPAHLICSTPDKLADIHDHVLRGGRYPGLGASLGLAAKSIETKPRLMFCVECAEADARKLGITYWHRQHQLIGLGYCHRHSTPLTYGCGRCRYSQRSSRSARLPQNECWCGQPLDLTSNMLGYEDRRVVVRFARYGNRLLAGEMKGWNANSLGKYFREQAVEFGYGSGNYIKSDELAQQIKARYSVQVLKRANANPIDSAPGGWVAYAMRNYIAPCILGRTLLFFDFFGGRLPDEQDLLRLAESSVKRRGEFAKGGYGLRLHHHPIEDDRTRIEDFLTSNPDATRTGLQNALGKVVQRALYRDRNWYHDKLPSARRNRSARSADENDIATFNFDMRTAQHVRATAEALVSTQTLLPKKLTKSTLLRGAPRAGFINERMLKSMPATAVMLKTYVETKRQYQERYARIILLGPGVLEDKYRQACSATGLSMSDVTTLSFKIRAEHLRNAS